MNSPRPYRGRQRCFTQPYQPIASWRWLEKPRAELTLACGHVIERCGTSQGRNADGSRRYALRISGAKCRACAVLATREAFGDVDYRAGSPVTRVPASAAIEGPTLRQWRPAASGSSGSSKP